MLLEEVAGADLDRAADAADVWVRPGGAVHGGHDRLCREPHGLGFARRPFAVRGRSLSLPVPVGEWRVRDRLRRYICTGAGWRHRVAHPLWSAPAAQPETTRT